MGLVVNTTIGNNQSETIMIKNKKTVKESYDVSPELADKPTSILAA